jgi:hypothetical protein
MWWLMRIASVLLGVGIGSMQTIWIREFPEDEFCDIPPQMILCGAMMLGGALFLIIELLLERKLRK